MINGSLTAGDVGITIVIDAGGYDLTGATCTLLAAPGSTPSCLGAAERLTPLTITDDGFYATYMTTGADFTTGGPWQLQLEVATSSGDVFTSPPAAFYVNPLLQT